MYLCLSSVCSGLPPEFLKLCHQGVYAFCCSDEAFPLCHCILSCDLLFLLSRDTYHLCYAYYLTTYFSILSFPPSWVFGSVGICTHRSCLDLRYAEISYLTKHYTTCERPSWDCKWMGSSTHSLCSEPRFSVFPWVVPLNNLQGLFWFSPLSFLIFCLIFC